MNQSTSESHFDAVIVGSGFGGSVTAYRLAEAGLDVCVLERGKAYPPGEFPRAPQRMQKNFWDPSEGLHGMYNIWSFSGLGAVVCSGLGGGSLIYANVLIRKDEKWFVKEDLNRGGFEYWPVTRADLDPHYDRVEKMLGAQQYPIDDPPYNEVPKAREFRDAAKRLGLDHQLPKLAVTFGNEGEKPAPGEPIRGGYWDIEGRKRTRYTCRLVGECDIGCNYGSKNTLDYNYLSEAKRLGAQILTRCEVKEFEPRDGGGYAVRYVRHEPEREGQKTDTSRLPRKTLTTDRLILSAGTMGSTFLLLKMKNRGAFPRIRNPIGTRFCGNGDLVTFALKSSQRKDGEQVPRLIDAGYGPVITGAIRFRDREDGGEGRGFYIEDAGYPNFVNWILETVETPGEAIRQFWGGLAGRFLDKLLSREPETDIGAEVARLLGSTEFTADLLPLLGMGRDVPDGKMSLRGERLDLDWRMQKSEPYFDGIREKMRDVAEELGASFSDPLEHLNRVVTVHPLGGCPMGRNETEGVVNEYGAVYGCPPGLYVADGSVMPGPVGPNPSLTIAALADRFADPIIERKGANVGTFSPAMDAGPIAQREYFVGPPDGHLVLDDLDGTVMSLELYQTSSSITARGFFLRSRRSPYAVCRTELVVEQREKESIEKKVQEDIQAGITHPALMQPLSTLHEPLEVTVKYRDLPSLRITVDPPDPDSSLFTGFFDSDENEERIAFHYDEYNPERTTPLTLVINQLNVVHEEESRYVPMSAYAEKCFTEAAKHCGGEDRVKTYEAKKRWFRIRCGKFKCR